MKQYSYLVVYSANYSEYITELDKNFNSQLMGNINIITNGKLQYKDLDKTKEIIQQNNERELNNILILNLIYLGKIKKKSK